MLNKILSLTALSAFVLCGAYAEDPISEETTTIARCPCRDKKDPPSDEGTVLVCGCDEENEGDDIVNTLAHHGDENEHDLANDDNTLVG